MRTRSKFGKFGVEDSYPLFEFEDRGYKTPCWIWKRSMNNNGYGKWRKKGYDTNLAHKVMFLMSGGVIPHKFELDHLCKNRSCIRPDHLETVLKVINARRGLRAKLTITQILEIYTKRDAGEKVLDLAKYYGVSDRTICAVSAQRGIYEN